MLVVAPCVIPEFPESAGKVQLAFLEFPQHAGEIPAGPLVKCASGRVETIARATAAYSRPITWQARAHRVRLSFISPESHSAASTMAGHDRYR